MSRPVAVHPALYTIETVTPPAEEPVTLDEAKEFLRVEDTADDAMITAMIVGARVWAENYTRRAFVTRSLRARLTDTPVGTIPIVLPYPEVAEPLTSIQYEDADGASQSLDVADFIVEPTFGIVRPNVGTEWPTALAMDFAYDAGYGLAVDVPEVVKIAIKVALTSMYEIRVDQVVGTIVSTPHTKSSKRLLEGFKVWEV